MCVCSYAVRCGTRLSSNARLHLVRGKRAVLCCAVMSLEINNNEVGRWLAGFVRGWTITERHRPDRNMHPITKQRQ